MAEGAKAPSAEHSHLADINPYKHVRMPENFLRSKVSTPKGKFLTFDSGSKVTCAKTSSVSGSAYPKGYVKR